MEKDSGKERTKGRRERRILGGGRVDKEEEGECVDR